ncbi:MAG: 1,2-phenylacetyl-CoA epoxidase subunit PaaE [Bacteroidota bacterium]
MSRNTQFYPLKVSQIDHNAQDCVLVSFEVPTALQNDFLFRQGQYLTLKAEIGGEDVRRSYSLCSSPMDQQWRVGIKKVPDGRFSTFANEALAVGDEIEVMPPDGRFFVEVDPSGEREYVCFAAGSGITPIYSIIKTHLQAEPDAHVKLFYINQTVSSIILKEELEALKNRFMGRLEIFYFLTQESRSVPLFNGRINEEKLEVIFKSICDVEQIDHYFMCGPEAMIMMVRDFLQSKGVEKKQIHFELFFTDTKPSVRRSRTQTKDASQQAAVTILEGGKSFQFKIPKGSENILDAALNREADLPFACKGGVCCTCRAKLVKGEVDMAVNYALEDEEVADGYILTCQAVPLSDEVIVDFDA